jgi:methylenetetrahydrofolate reductase (NADPH)
MASKGSYISVGENIHCTRVKLSTGKFVQTLDDGSKALVFKDQSGNGLLPIPASIVGGDDWQAGKVRHVAVAVQQGLYGNAADKEAGRRYVAALAREQEAYGSWFLDLNVDEFSTDRPEKIKAMQWVAKAVQEASSLPLSIDSSDPDILAAGLEACDPSKGRPLINSVSLERASFIPIAAKAGAAVIAGATGENSMPESVEERLENLAVLIGKLKGVGIALCDIYLDPLVYPASVVPRRDLPPKQDSEKLERTWAFAEKFNRVMESGYCACITDNAMGNLAFQGTEMIEELGLEAKPDQVMIHLNTFHTKGDLHEILDSCKAFGIRQLLVVTGDGSDRLPKLHPADIGATGVESVTSVELLRYIPADPGDFELGVAFNPYEPEEEHEFAKLERKLAAGATFVITQPVIDRTPWSTSCWRDLSGVPVIVEAWMSKKLDLLSDAVGYEIPEDTPFDPIATLKTLHRNYPQCGIYLSLLGFKTQYDQHEDTWELKGSRHEDRRLHQAGARHQRREDRSGDQAHRPRGHQGHPQPLRHLRHRGGGQDARQDSAARSSRCPWVRPRPTYAPRGISVGADRAVLLSDRAFGGSDTWATSYALAKAIRKIGGVDLVICGKQAIDGDTAQVGPGIAAHLGWPQATYVMAVRDMADGRLPPSACTRMAGTSARLTLPAVMTVVKDINQPRIPTLKGRLAAQKMEIPTWTAADIGAEPFQDRPRRLADRGSSRPAPPPAHKETLRS